MENDSIVKVFHDFCEDSTALVNQYAVQSQHVFDTQIAHRLLCQKAQGDDYKTNNAGLNELLALYLGVENDRKNGHDRYPSRVTDDMGLLLTDIIA